MAYRTFNAALYLRECSGKVIYQGRKVAKRAALNLQADIGEQMNAYRCSSGPHYHIGHTPWRKRKGAA